MTVLETDDSFTIDRIDRQLLHALQLNGRASFARLAEVIGCSEQTAARRYRRLREHGVIRVVVVPETQEEGLDWFVRAEVRPGAAERLAEALAQRDDVIWVSIIAGGSEVLCATRPSGAGQQEDLLLERLPATNLLTGLTAQAILRRYAHGVHEWAAFGDPLEPDQIAALADGWDWDADGEAVLEAADGPLVAVLAEDGRASYAQLAAASGLSPARAARRVTALLSSGALRADVEMLPELLGFPMRAMLWLTVAPSELDPTARAIAQLPETAFVGALTGVRNLCVSVACRDTGELYRHVTETLGVLPGVRDVEISLILRQLKQARSVITDGRLPRP